MVNYLAAKSNVAQRWNCAGKWQQTIVAVLEATVVIGRFCVAAAASGVFGQLTTSHQFGHLITSGYAGAQQTCCFLNFALAPIGARPPGPFSLRSASSMLF